MSTVSFSEALPGSTAWPPLPPWFSRPCSTWQSCVPLLCYDSKGSLPGNISLHKQCHAQHRPGSDPVCQPLSLAPTMTCFCPSLPSTHSTPSACSIPPLPCHPQARHTHTHTPHLHALSTFHRLTPQPAGSRNVRSGQTLPFSPGSSRQTEPRPFSHPGSAKSRLLQGAFPSLARHRRTFHTHLSFHEPFCYSCCSPPKRTPGDKMR